MGIPTKLLVGAAFMLGLAALTAQPEFILPALLFAGGSAYAKRHEKQKQLAGSLEELEKRLRVTEGDLEATTDELEQLRMEREFDRQLLRDPKTPPKS